MKKGEGITYKLPVRKVVRDGKCSIGNRVNNVIITIYGVGWVLELLG